MDANSYPNPTLRNSRVAEGQQCPPHGYYGEAVASTPREGRMITGSRGPGMATAHAWTIKSALIDVAEVLRRTLRFADLARRPRSGHGSVQSWRVSIPLKVLFDYGYLQRGRMVAENLESVTCNSEQDRVPSADAPRSATHIAIGLKHELA
jgi:hypothetical protein